MVRRLRVHIESLPVTATSTFPARPGMGMATHCARGGRREAGCGKSAESSASSPSPIDSTLALRLKRTEAAGAASATGAGASYEPLRAHQRCIACSVASLGPPVTAKVSLAVACGGGKGTGAEEEATICRSGRGDMVTSNKEPPTSPVARIA